jgi:hypothetical protein
VPSFYCEGFFRTGGFVAPAGGALVSSEPFSITIMNGFGV